MSGIKYSRQREAIKEYLRSTTSHPTADTVYMEIRDQFPKISLGTVYRNLSLLAEIGEISRISTGDGADRFDGNPADHLHFVCRNCHKVLDLEGKDFPDVIRAAGKDFDGQIERHVTYFYGLCGDCVRKQQD